MKFSYKKYGPYMRPVILVRIKNAARAVRYEVLIDSGADECIFDTGIAEILGIKVEEGGLRKAAGIAGQTSVYFVHPVEIEVGGWTYKINAGFMDRASGNIPYGVVGQKGFFDLFIIKFDLLKAEIELKQRNI